MHVNTEVCETKAMTGYDITLYMSGIIIIQQFCLVSGIKRFGDKIET